MRGSIALHLAVVWLVLLGLDRFWPIWPVHVATVVLGAVAAVLAGLAVVAAGRR